MAKISIFNIGKANEALDSAHAAANKGLIAAKITTLAVDGKEVPSADAPLNVKIDAVSALVNSGDKTQDVSELIASNGQIASQVEDLTGKLSVANATASAHAQKISSLEGELVTSKSSVQSLTAQLATSNTNLVASNDLNTKLTSQSNTVNAEISKHCISINCLTLVDKDGKPLAKDATDDQKLASALNVPISEKVAALKGAVTSAIANVGLTVAVPAAGQPVAKLPGEGLSGIAKVEAQIAAQIAGQVPVKK
jgi:hypothetical protein